jgi:hypothetical protein
MKTFFKKLNDFIKEYDGIVKIVMFIVAIVAIYINREIKIPISASFFSRIWIFLITGIKIPTISIIIMIILLLWYLKKLKKRYTIQKISAEFLVGKWKNEWLKDDGSRGSETFQITEDLRYLFLDGRHAFDLKDLLIDKTKGLLSFTKISVQPGDHRRLQNNLSIKNNDLLVGREDDNHSIRYSRIQS